MAQVVVKKGQNLWSIAQQVFGDGSRWKELGYTGDPKKLAIGTVLNYGGSQSAVPQPAQATAPVAPVAPVETEQQRQDRLIAQWYGMAPKDVGQFNYTPEQEAADTRSVKEQYRPFYQEKVTQSGEDFTKALKNAREGFSRRGLWGASSGTAQTVDPATGLSNTVSTDQTQGGIQSGLRQAGERELAQQNERANTAFGRAYTEAVGDRDIGAVGRRRQIAENEWQGTIKDPYEEAKKVWMATYPQMK